MMLDDAVAKFSDTLGVAEDAFGQEDRRGQLLSGLHEMCELAVQINLAASERRGTQDPELERAIHLLEKYIALARKSVDLRLVPAERELVEGYITRNEERVHSMREMLGSRRARQQEYERVGRLERRASGSRR